MELPNGLSPMLTEVRVEIHLPYLSVLRFKGSGLSTLIQPFVKKKCKECVVTPNALAGVTRISLYLLHLQVVSTKTLIRHYFILDSGLSARISTIITSLVGQPTRNSLNDGYFQAYVLFTLYFGEQPFSPCPVCALQSIQGFDIIAEAGFPYSERLSFNSSHGIYQ